MKFKIDKTVKVICIILFTLLFISGETIAQNFEVGGGFIIGFPQGQFKDNIDNNGYGFTLNGGYAPQKNPFMIGLDFGYLIYGSETRTEPFSTTIPDVFVDVTTTNSIVLGNIVLRLQPNYGVFRPYIQGLLGFTYIFTTTEIKDQGNYEEHVASSTNFDDIAFNYGAGGGIMFRVYKAKENEGMKLKEVLIDIGVKYLESGEAEYLKEGSIRRENGIVIYDVNKSKTNLLTLQISASFRF
jgi:hypothetical protein